MIKKSIIIVGIIFIFSCKKQDEYLDKKASLSDIVPSSIKDYQAIMDNDELISGGASIGFVGSDNYYVSNANYLAAAIIERNAYVWKSDLLEGNLTDLGWNKWYQIVEYANIVVDGLGKITPDQVEVSAYNNALGCALFRRANSFYYLTNLFSTPYNKTTSENDIGIPIRTSSDINVKSIRNSVKECYTQIINDLQAAENLLPNTLPSVTAALTQARPSRLAAQSLLAKVYLSMSDYSNAGDYANRVLSTYSTLNKFSNYDSTLYSPIQDLPGNSEVIYFSYGSPYNINFSAIVDSVLYNSYDKYDLRRAFYYVNNLGPTERRFKGFPTGRGPFQGTTVGEMFLIRAESYARKGNKDSALIDLNKLVINRFVANTFTPYTAADADAALSLILTERRKEFPYSDLVRWIDLRRLNVDPRFAKTLTRVINGQTYTLMPNDKRYVYPIPLTEVRISGLSQNDR